MIRFFVAGTPQPQPRHRTTKAGHTWTPNTADGWRQRIAAEAVKYRPDTPILGPVELTLTFLFARPASHFGTGRNAGVVKPKYADMRHISRPDEDNCVKAVKDELQQMGFYRNDSQVWRLTAEKRWCTQGQRAGMEMEMK